MLNVFINGSAGFLGSAYCERYNPITFGYKAKDYPCFINYTDTSKLRDILRNANVIIHMEAYGANDNSLEHLESLNTLKRVIESAPPACKIIYLSSATLYNTGSEYHVSNENSLISVPDTLYLHSKLIGEKMVSACVRNYTILRVANVVGPNLRHGVVKNLMSNKIGSSVPVFTEFPGDVRSFVHVDTLCDVINRCTTSKITDCEIINVCSRDAINITELLSIMGLTASNYTSGQPQICIPSSYKLEKLPPEVNIQTSREVIIKALGENGYGV